MWVEQWEVESRTETGRLWKVSKKEDQSFACSCPRWIFKRVQCEHIQEVLHGGGRPIDPLIAAIEKAQRKAASLAAKKGQNEKAEKD